MAATVRLHAAVAGALGAGIDAEDSHAREASISFSSMSKLAQTCWTSSWSSSASISFSICLRVLALQLDVVLRNHRDLGAGRLDAERLHRVAHRLEALGRARRSPTTPPSSLMSSAPASSAAFEELLLVGLVLLDDDLALAV